ncbi:MAG: hypothetical protein DWI22_00195 [Planctomycetota bacterium]|nr:MAG: hypothetical protein DWI22_00195 [Planctomycetota bacterium]
MEAGGTVPSLFTRDARYYIIKTYDKMSELILSGSQYKLDNFSAENRQNRPTIRIRTKYRVPRIRVGGQWNHKKLKNIGVLLFSGAP